MKKIISYNVNGIRAAMTKGLVEWLRDQDADVVCFQELKAFPEQFDTTLFEALGYHHYWHPAQKPGYSGVGILTKTKPDHVEVGCGDASIDREGRILRADFGDVSVISVYIPSGSSGDERQDYKMEWLNFFHKYINELKRERPKLIISGDYNICHQAIDIHNPVSNANSSGFKPEERAWVGKFIDSGFVDSFRHFDASPHQYTWWSYRAGARGKNLGWRIDYHMVSEALAGSLKGAGIQADAKHSDHCPLSVLVDF